MAYSYTEIFMLWKGIDKQIFFYQGLKYINTVHNDIAMWEQLLLFVYCLLW